MTSFFFQVHRTQFAQHNVGVCVLPSFRWVVEIPALQNVFRFYIAVQYLVSVKKVCSSDQLTGDGANIIYTEPWNVFNYGFGDCGAVKEKTVQVKSPCVKLSCTSIKLWCLVLLFLKPSSTSNSCCAEM